MLMKEEQSPKYDKKPDFSDFKLIQEINLTLDKNEEKCPRSITCSYMASNAFREIWKDDMDIRERMYVIYINQNNRPSSGGIASTVIDVRLLFAPVFAKGMNALATGFFIAHNHPSGNLKPSSADKELTINIKELGKLHTITLYDHLIMNNDSYYSFSDESLVI